MESKKKASADIEKRKGYYFSIGLVIALSFALVSFEWSQFQTTETLSYSPPIPEEDMIDVRVIKVKKEPIPELPKPKKEKELRVVDELTKEVKQEEDPVPDQEEETDPFEFEYEDGDNDEDKEVDNSNVEIPRWVQQMPEFIGGDDELYKFLGRNTKYPPRARNNGTQGIVLVSFVVSKDGSISQVKVARGIGDGCDQEAVRVVKKMPKWKAGRQDDRPVAVRCQIPIVFKLVK